MKYRKPKQLSEITVLEFCHQYEDGDIIEPISYWPIRAQEISIISSLCKHIEPNKEKRTLLDLNTGLGFIPYLFVQSDNFNKVYGANPPGFDMFPAPYQQNKHLKIETIATDQLIDKYKHKILCLTCVYMESDRNLTPIIFKINPKLIIYVTDKSGICGPVSLAEWEKDDIRAFDPGQMYRTILRWDGPSHYCIKAKTESSFCDHDDLNQNTIEIQLRKDIPLPVFDGVSFQKFKWENYFQPISFEQI